jgi:hypothetical protein
VVLNFAEKLTTCQTFLFNNVFDRLVVHQHGIENIMYNISGSIDDVSDFILVKKSSIHRASLV